VDAGLLEKLTYQKEALLLKKAYSFSVF